MARTYEDLLGSETSFVARPLAKLIDLGNGMSLRVTSQGY